MSQLAALKSATSLSDVALLLGFKPSALSYILYKKGTNYKKFEIPKRHGGVRPIAAPTDHLKLVQRRLAGLLQNCTEEIAKSKSLDDQISHGFKRGHSIATNARVHRKRRFVFNIDLNNFFGSINFGRVRGFLIKDKNFALNDSVATVLAQIICYENGLPQGSPCSPVVSNLIGHVLDIHLVRLAARSGCTYTRYADDLTFSTNKSIFPTNVAQPDAADPATWYPGTELVELINRSGFSINPTKTRMQYRNSRQEVTGLVVNRMLNTRKEYRYNIRAMVHHLVTKGSFEFIQSEVDTSGKVTAKKAAGTPAQLRGMLSFIDGIDSSNRKINEEVKNIQKEKTKPSSRDRTYLRFLLFTEFYAAQRPVVICEGPTDNIYLLHAVRSLASKYPKLATVHPDGKIGLSLRFIKHSKSSTTRILGIHGGTGELSKLLWTYHNEKIHFKAPGLVHPVIFLIDNDSGAKPIYETIKKLTGAMPTGSEDFIHVTANLYVVATPSLTGGGFSKIEDLFDAATLETIVDGKKFNSNDKNSDTEYGKMVFAHKVVAPHANKIDFSGFESLLARFVSVIDAHAKKIADPAETGSEQPK